MRIHTIMHADFEKLGVIEHWASERNAQLTISTPYQNSTLPRVDEFDFLILMGGPQSVTNVEEYPYLSQEINLTRNAINNEKIVLGICLGAQIISEALGAAPVKSPHSEVGIYPIRLTQHGISDPLFRLFPKQFDVVHWHNDMPGIPSGAFLLAESDGCPHQAFRYGDKVYGLQFHMEMTARDLQDMVQHCQHDLQPGNYVQTSQQLLSTDLETINKKMYKVLDYLASILKR